MGSNQTILLTRKSKSKYNLLEKLGDVAIMVTIAYRLVCQYCKLLIRILQTRTTISYWTEQSFYIVCPGGYT